MFKLTMRTSNDEFGEAGVNTTVARLLREAADKIARGSDYGTVVDGNGNSVGSFEIDLAGEDREVRDGEQFDTLLSSWPALVAEAEALVNVDGFVLDEDALDEWQAGDVLSVDVEHIHTVMLGINGPTQYVEIKCTPDDEAISMLWINTHGDQTASRNVQQGTSLWNLMARAAGVEA